MSSDLYITYMVNMITEGWADYHPIKRTLELLDLGDNQAMAMRHRSKIEIIADILESSLMTVKFEINV